MKTQKVIAAMMMLVLASACSEDEGSGKMAIPSNNDEQDMQEQSEPDMPADEPDMAEPDMPESDMEQEQDMVVMDSEVSGTWTLSLYPNQMVGEEVATVTIMKAMDSPEITGTYEMADGGETGDLTSGTYLEQELEYTWRVGNSQLDYQFLGGSFEGDVILGTYNDPEQGGIPADAIMERQDSQ